MRLAALALALHDPADERESGAKNSSSKWIKRLEEAFRLGLERRESAGWRPLRGAADARNPGRTLALERGGRARVRCPV